MTETSVDVRGRTSLTPVQRALFASQQRDPGSPMQNMVLMAHISGAIDAHRLADAFAVVVDASDVLRSQITTGANGETTVRISHERALTEVIDLPRTQAQAWAQRRAREVLPLSRRAYDSAVLVHDDDTVSWYLALHHCVTDAFSSARVFQLTADAYAGESVEIPPYYSWEGLTDRGAAHERAMLHWAVRPPAPRIGQLYERQQPPTSSSTRVPVPVDHELAAALDALTLGRFRSMSTDLSWTTILLCTTAVQLHRISGADRFAIGVPVHNRSRPGARDLLGPLVEVYPVDIVIEPDDSFAVLHRRISRSLNQTLRHAEPGTAPAGTDIEVVVNVIPTVELSTFGSHPAHVEWIHPGASDANHLMRVQLARFGPPQLVLDLNHGASSEQRTARVAAHSARILREMAEEPDAHIGGFSLLTPDERIALDSWGDGPTAEPAVHVIDRLALALRDRHDIAIVDGSTSWSGRELWTRVERLAATLQTGGIGPGDRVAIEMRRSAEAVVAILATMRAGASYVPIDPEQPATRRDDLIERAGCTITLRDGSGSPVAGTTLQPVERSLDAEAYLLFTSGSTGEPKGVPISHRGLAGYLAFAVEHYVSPDDRPVVPLFSALTFDLTVTSLFLPLLTGGRSVVFGEDGPVAMQRIATSTDLTWCKATPSHLELLVRLLPPEHSLSTLVVGGEAFATSLARRLRAALPGVRIFNEYGPTEAVVGCMIHEWNPDEFPGCPDVPIGRPAPGVGLRVLDRSGHDVPPGAIGELHIAHPGLTVGYLDGDLSAFSSARGRRWYRSGDLVRMLDDSTLVYLRRVDEQLKVGGIRLDPSEIEAALELHPAVRRAAVRAWSPEHRLARRHCVRCGLADNVPNVVFDDAGVCDRCHSYEAIRVQADVWFRDQTDLLALRDRARAERTGRYDCIALLSGGKDSTYALFQLVQMGFDVYALTLDNGFISDGAKENVRRSVAALGIDHEFATTEAMAAIFRDSLERHSNVCHGCFKTIYTLGTNRAVELGAPLVVTGLSRGQLFETRLIPAQFSEHRFDADAIDAAVVAARRSYHRIDDAVRRLMDTEVFNDDALFDRIEYVDFYRYVDVDLTEMLRFLDEEAPWVRPSDTGRSTNCRINAAGIQTHLLEQGYHNYAEPYAWDVRLGHKQREQALAELDDRDDEDEVAAMLAEVGYTPRTREILAAWIEVGDDATAPSPAELRVHLQGLLPAHAVPAAFVIVEELPLTTNGKLDVAALPAPRRTHRSSPTLVVAPTSELERRIVELWERHLGIDTISVDDDFFALGGDSLAALEMTMMLSDALGRDVSEEIVFSNTTPSALAAALDGHHAADHGFDGLGAGVAVGTGPEPSTGGDPPRLSAGERSMLFEHRMRPDDPRYNQGRLYVLDGLIDPERFRAALADVIARHEPLHWTFDEPRRRLTVDDALAFTAGVLATQADVREAATVIHRTPFELASGPLVRCGLFEVDGTTAIVLATHHISTDAGSFDRLWKEAVTAYRGEELPPLPSSYSDHATWQANRLAASNDDYWLASIGAVPRMQLHRPFTPAPDGLRERVAEITTTEFRSATGTSPFATVLAALATVMRRYCGADEITLGALVSTRDHASAENLVGYYLNTLPLTFRVDPGGHLADLRTQSAETLASGLAHRVVPFADMVTGRRRAELPEPAPQVLVALQELDEVSFGSLHGTQEILFTGTAVADATFFVQQRGGNVVLAIEHRGSELSAEIADRLLADLDTALTALVRRPDAVVGSITLDSQHAGRLVGSTPAAAPHVIAQITRVMGDQPHDVAIRCGDRSLTWQALDHASTMLAHRLVAVGVRPSDRVVVTLPRSVELVVAIVAVLRADAAYVPLDPTYPTARNRSIALASDARAVIGELDVDGFQGNGVVVDLDDLSTAQPDEHGELPPPDIDGPAYTIFTSGSTGEPRGVTVGHRELAISTAARSTVYGAKPERFLVVSSASFDSSVAGLFWTLTAGGTVVLPTDAEVHDADALIDLFASADITHTLMVPSLYRGLLGRAAADAAWPDQVIVAGEACGPDVLASHLATRPGSRLSNEYGPTEATVWATVSHLDSATPGVPIGDPIPGVWTAVVDDRGELCPAGVIGELLIGGETVTRGYDGVDSDRFGGASPLGAGRTFLTGDRAAVAAGQLYFHGRVDDQLNAGGLRIEPTEIEIALKAVSGVEEAIVVARDLRPLDARLASTESARLADAMRRAAGSDDPLASLDDELADDAHRSLVAHLEGDLTAVDLDALDAHLSATLPPTATPRVIRIHERLPRSPNGKLDRAAITMLPVTASSRQSPVVPGSIGELDEIVGFFRDVLDRNDVGPDDDFFDAGGESLLALELFMRIEQRFGIRPRVSVLFEARTPRELTAALGFGGLEQRDGALVLRDGSGESPPLWIWPGSDGALLIFERLVDRLDPGLRVLGVEYPGTRGERAPFDTIEDLGRYCHEALVAAQPSGPYRMLGYSTGGLVAVDVARRLLETGEDVDYLGVIEAGVAGVADPRGRAAKFVDAWRTRGPRFAAARLRSSTQVLTDEVTKTIRRSLEDLAVDRFGIRPSDRRLFLGMEHHFRAASLSYRPPTIDADIDLYLGDDASAHWITAMTHAWESVAGGRLRVVQVDGSHIRNTMLLPPHVDSLAASVAADLVDDR